MYKPLFILLIILLGSDMQGQRFSGNSFGGYSGVYGIQDNPATFVNKKPKWDINIVGTGIHLYNDYGYVKDQSLMSFFNRSIVDANDSIPSGFNEDEEQLFYAEPYTKPINALLFNHITSLPSFVANFGPFSAGLFTTVRSHIDNTDAPVFLNYANLKTITEGVPYNITPTKVNGMAWGEIGINLGHQLELNNGNRLALGINVKHLLGFESAYIRLNQDYDFTRLRDTFFSSYSNLDVGFATGASLRSDDYSFGVQGRGWGFDLGAEYMIPHPDEESTSLHWMKFGVAIKDIGGIDFTQNTETHKFVTDDYFGITNTLTSNRNANYDVIRRISQRVFLDSGASKTGTSFVMNLPTSLNLHWDYNFRPDFYIHGFITRRVNTLKTQLSAPNVIMLSGRYEKRWFEAGMSMSLTEDKWLGVGTYLRLGLFTIGSDHINTIFLKQPKFRGSDIYFSLKLMPFGSGGSKEEAADRFHNKSGGRSKCFTYR